MSVKSCRLGDLKRQQKLRVFLLRRSKPKNGKPFRRFRKFALLADTSKSLANALGIDEKMAIAVLRRDYPPKKININPKPDVSSRFTWSPKLTFAVGIGAVILIVLGYLVFQYTKFISPPGLTIGSPKENQVVDGNSVLVFGSTDQDAKITVNNQPVLTDADGKFSVSLGVTSTTKEVDIIAVSRSGKINEIKRKIEVQ